MHTHNIIIVHMYICKCGYLQSVLSFSEVLLSSDGEI